MMQICYVIGLAVMASKSQHQHVKTIDLFSCFSFWFVVLRRTVQSVLRAESL